jgi:DNA (cytosine-5)-methyltransferase 1
MYEMWADELIHLAARKIHNLRVDILHLSPPCQFFSPAHTVAGKDDEMNSATIFACGPLIDAAKPRLLTLEQTFGITHDRFAGYLHSVINMLTSRGFSVRWTVAPLQNWVCQLCFK